MESLANEYFKIMEVISSYDGYLLTIKGWSITVGMALIGYAFQKRNKFLVLLCCVSSVCFALMDAKYKQYQSNYYPRMQTIEACLRSYQKPCTALQVDESWNRSHMSNNLWSQFDKANVVVPHGILFALSLVLFFIPSLITHEKTANNTSKRDAEAGAHS